MEVTRACLEEIERLENSIVRDLDQNPNTHKERLVQQHRVHGVLGRICKASDRVMNVMDDKDGSRREELGALSGKDVFNNFYSRMKDIRDYHRKFPDQSDIVLKEDGSEMTLEDQLLAEEPLPEFTGEEGMGRWVDMHLLYNRFINIKLLDGEPMDYLSFLDQVRHLDDLPQQRMFLRSYLDWLEDTFSYLKGFHKRVQPLQNLDKIIVKVQDDFEAKYAADKQAEKPMSTEALDKLNSVADAQALGMDTLKAELTQLGLKCGGTLEQRAERFFACKGKLASDLDASFFAKAKGKKDKKKKEGDGNEKDSQKATELKEVIVTKLCEMLGDQLDSTKSNIEKKQSRTFQEVQEELDAMETEIIDDESEEEDEDAPIYNPLNLPLGWDGKPIPFWLYKLHGLNIEYKCEICGNYAYWGPRAYERHFQEWRHAHGMRCLGIPNTNEFRGITLIQDAIDLWLKIKKRNKDTHFNENDEEFEDSAGNVMSKRTYEDLKKQGLLGDF
jgi:splicing factor 3A subunit 3